MTSAPAPDSAGHLPGIHPVAAERWRRLPRQTSPWLHEEIASRMVERLQWFRDPPTSWLHWEPVLGGLQAHARLRAALPDARWHVASHDLARARAATREEAPRSWNPLRRRSDALAEPPDPARPVQLLWANMGLHAEAAPHRALEQWRELLAPGGFLLLSCLGPDSLLELRAVYAQMGWPLPAHPFTDMHDWGDMLVRAGFAEPVMDMERLTLTYGSAEAMLAELRELGRNLSVQRFPALRGRAWRQRLVDAIERLGTRDADGRLSLTMEVIYGHAVRAEPRSPSGQTSLPLDQVRAQLRQRRG